MRYIEYVYLAMAAGIAGYLAVNYKHMTTTNVVVMSIGAAIAAFVYSFRRAQRLQLEKQEREEEEQNRKEGEHD